MKSITKSFLALARWIDSVNNVMLTVSGMMVVVMMLSTSYEVVARYFFHAPTAWSLELAENLMVATVFLGAGYCCLI
jgi:C4-dicarboxylate transporter DctQ subunit